MKFSKLISILDSAQIIEESHIAEDLEISDLNLMDPEYQDFQERTVYFMNATEIGNGTIIPSFFIYQDTLPPSKVKYLKNYARISPSVSLARAFRYTKLQLNETAAGDSQYATLVSRLLSGDSLQSVLDATSAYTGVMYIAIDRSGKILAHSNPFHVDYPLWMHSVQQGYCDEVLMDYIRSRRNAIHASSQATVIDLYCRKIDMYILVSRIKHNSEQLGYFFALSKLPHFDSCTRRILPIFARQVKDSMIQLKSIRQMDNYLEVIKSNILLDALEGSSPDETGHRLKMSGIKFWKHMRVLSIHHNESNPLYASRVLLPKLEQEFPSWFGFAWHQQLIALVATDNSGNFSAEIQAKWEAFAREHHLTVGLSNVFSDVADFRTYFEQAQTAQSFADRLNSSNIFFHYQDYLFYVILDQVDNIDLLRSCCHPALDILLKSGGKKGRELFDTLWVYTETSFNKAHTAQLLFVHRNTIDYRLQQIERICNISLSPEKDEKLLFTLQLSFKIYAFLNSRAIV